MFFVLSKVLSFLIKPSVWLVALLVVAIFTKHPRRRKRCLVATLVLFLLFSNHLLFNLVMHAYEEPPVPFAAIEEPYDIGILLGGYTYTFVPTSDDRHTFNYEATRLTETLELYQTGRIEKILLTGGSGRVLGEAKNEAEMMVRFLTRMKIPREDIIVEKESRNTRENAVFSKAIIEERYPGARCLLITSSWHMPRAEACFRAVDLPVDPFPTGHRQEAYRFAPESWLIPDARGLFHWEFLIKEWVGYAVYYSSGYAR